MALPELGLIPGRTLAYSWIGDPAVDHAKSDLKRWAETGEGLVALEGQALTVFHCAPLDDTTLQGVYRLALSGVTRPSAASPVQDDYAALSVACQPRVCYLAVAYSVERIEEGKPLQRAFAGGAMRLTDESMAYLARFRVRKSDSHEAHSLVTHLGELVLAMSSLSELEGKA